MPSVDRHLDPVTLARLRFARDARDEGRARSLGLGLEGMHSQLRSASPVSPSWMPVAWRAPVRPDDRVLVLGATGTAGRVALQAARLLGAASVVAAGRDGDFRRARPTIFDPLCGEPLERAVAAAAPGARIVQLGQSAAPAATLPSAAIRSKQLDLHGYSDFAVPPDVLGEHYRRLVGHALAGEIRLEVERVGLDELAWAWERRGKVVVCL